MISSMEQINELAIIVYGRPLYSGFIPVGHFKGTDVTMYALPQISFVDTQEKFGALFSSNLDIFEEDDGVASIDVPVLDFSSETESELDEESPVTLTQEQ